MSFGELVCVVEKKNIFIITGGPSVGKTALLRGLRAHGCKCFDEVARQIIDEQLKVGGDIVPWIKLDLFNQHVLVRMIEQYSGATSEPHFFDRGLPDNVGYLRLGNTPLRPELEAALKKHRYNKVVFFLEPWKEIYINDAARKEPFEFAVKVSDCIKGAYVEFGYDVIVVPKVSVEERVEFVLNKVKELGKK